MGGYEGADHLNGSGTPLHLNALNGHWSQLDEDYRQLSALGIRTIRESIGWRVSTSADGVLDSAALRARAACAARHGLQVIWTLHHYGLPTGVDFFAADFAPRFADFCDQVARALKGVADEPTVYQPINEISFLSWAAGCTHLIHPHTPGDRSYELKCRLVGAALKGCDALWATEPGARMVHTDPVIHVVAPHDANDAQHRDAHIVNQQQYQAWDMLAGRLEAGLGGAPCYLDILGANYYHGNQWEHPGGHTLHWHVGDARRRGLEVLLGDIWARYGRPLFIGETGHVGDGRATWLDDIGEAAQRCLANGVPLEGVCLYPLIDRPDWEAPSRWHRSGLWEVRPQPSAHSEPTFSRALNRPYASRLAHWQATLPVALPARHPPSPVPFSLTHQGSSMSPLIVFSHLRWDFVYQRPQQLLSRFAAQRPVIFVEEPIVGASHNAIERLHPCQGVEVLRLHVTGAPHGFDDEHLPAMREMLATYLKQRAITDYWLWFYTPMALPLALDLEPAGIVYDCMDELSAFLNAPPQLLQREDALFELADLVFTGGFSLYEAKRERHPQVFCFPSSVDAAHYSRASKGAMPTGSFDDLAQAHIATPRLGYCGVIDERVDLALIDALAARHPEWQIVMVGPVVKIDPATLPRRANIHWLGQRDYADLPDLIHGWDVCLLPFALNESTRFISPTKTLEYLAAGRPVVSTPIRDVVSGYTGIVAIADTADGFVSACEVMLARTPAKKAADAAAVATLLERTSWDRTTAAMSQLIAEHSQPAFEEAAGIPIAGTRAAATNGKPANLAQTSAA